MNRITHALLLLAGMVVLGGAGGDNVRNGAGWVEYQILETWQNVPAILKPCLINRCGLDENETKLVASVAKSPLWNHATPVYLPAAKTNASFPSFASGERGLAGIEYTADSVRYVIDLNALYLQDSDGSIKTPTTRTIVRDLLAIALQETESAQATVLSEKVAGAVFPAGHVADRFMSFAKYGEPHSGVLITKFDRVGLAVSDDLGTHRLDTLVVASLKCRSPKSTAEGILSLEGMHWEETLIEKGRVTFRLRGNVIYACSTHETLYAQIRIGLRFELDPDDIDRLFSGFGLFGDLKWVPTLTSVDLYQIR